MSKYFLLLNTYKMATNIGEQNEPGYGKKAVATAPKEKPARPKKAIAAPKKADAKKAPAKKAAPKKK